MRRGMTVLLMLLATGCEVEWAAAPRPCPGMTVAVDPVAGDVNDTFLRAVVTEGGAPVVGESVLFRIAKGSGEDAVWALGAGTTDADGAAYFDFGAVVLASESHAAGAAKATTVLVVVDRTGFPDGRDTGCVTKGSAAFAPTRRKASAPPRVAADAAGLRKVLREFVAAVPAREDVPPRLDDGRSACRMLLAAAADARRHPSWLGTRPMERLRGTAASCANNARETAEVVRELLADAGP